MKLLSIHIDNFGKLRDFDLDLGDGVNTVFADNGYGKTTLAAFVKAMLYGLSKVGTRVKDLNENERKHYTPWQGGAFGGYIDIETEKGRYRVSRSFGAKPAADTFTLIDLNTRLESGDYSEDIGAELFGIDADSYEKSTYIPQRDIPIEMTANINTKLTRLLESSNDIDELDRAVKMLENYSKSFKLYKGNGGLIYDTQLKLNQAESHIEACHDAKARAQRYTERLEEIKNITERTENEIRDIEAELEQINRLTVKYNDFKTLEQYRNDAKEAEKLLEKRKLLFKNAIPTQDELSSLERKAKDVTLAKTKSAYRKEASDSQKKLDEYKKRFGDEPLTRNYLESVSKNINNLNAAEAELHMTPTPTEPVRPTSGGSSNKLLLPLACVMAAVGAILCFVNLFVGIALIAVGAVTLSVGVAFASKARTELNKANKDYEAKLEAYNAAKEHQTALTERISELRSELDAVIAKYYPDHLGSYDAALTKLCTDTEHYRELLKDSQKEDDKENTELEAAISSARLDFSRFTDLTDDDFDGALKDIGEKLRAIEAAENELNARLNFAKKYAEEKGLSGEAPTLPDRSSVEQKLSEMRKRVSELNLLYGSEKQSLERLEEAADSLPEYTDEAERLRGEIAVYEEKRNTAESAKEFLKRASYNLSSRYLRKMEQSFKENYKKASYSAMPTPNIDAELGLSFRDGGAERGTEWYSEGIRSLINLCMRLALTDALFENEAPFLVLDDPFSELDGTNLEKAKALIKELGRDRQIIYLTCHESRKIQ